MTPAAQQAQAALDEIWNDVETALLSNSSHMCAKVIVKHGEAIKDLCIAAAQPAVQEGIEHGSYLENALVYYRNKARDGLTAEPFYAEVCLKAIVTDPTPEHPKEPADAEKIAAWRTMWRFVATHENITDTVKNALAILKPEGA